MKKLATILITITVLLIVIVLVYEKLPISVTRYSKIKTGNKIIENIEKYKGLPDEGDWETLRSLGFIEKPDFLAPEYFKLDNETFQLVFMEGFDGPHLMWNSKKKWKMEINTQVYH